MRCAQLWAALLLLPKIDVGDQIDRQINRHIILTVPHWGPLEPSVKINTLQRWIPRWKLIDIQKLQKDRGRPDGPTDILYCHSGDLTLWPTFASAARNYGLRFYYQQKDKQMTIQ